MAMRGNQTAEAQAFIKRVLALPQGPGVSLDDALQPSIDDEAELRRFWATDKTNIRLQNPYVGLVDVFAAPKELRTIRARVVNDQQDLDAKHVLPLSAEKRRKEGSPSMAEDLGEFKRNWTIFTEGSLSQLTDWSNVVAAGGSVQACLTPLTDEQKVSKRAIRKHYHAVAYPSSDIDLFLWGLTPAQAEEKIKQIYDAVRDSVTWDVTCVRTKHTISIYCQYPYRFIQIVLRLYSSPAEILAGFDVDAPCFAYDGSCVWGNPRAIVAMMRQCNTVDMTRRSPSYEVRLTKYASRGFEVYVPSLRRIEIDPTIYERSITRIQGLARLLVLEKLSNADARNSYLASRRTLRGRPNPPGYTNYHRRARRRYKNDLKGDDSFSGLEMNNYDVASLHIPYGPGWNARRIEKLVYSTDLGMNSTFNPKNKDRRLHRHVAFFGTIEEVLEDCCEHCPIPIDEDEKSLQEEEDKQYIRGRISFIEEDPGRQTMSGSFNPIDVGEWSEQVHIGPVERFFRAIAAHDIDTVRTMLKDGYDVHRRDHVGRTVLHAAILCGSQEIACELVDAGARMTARLVDGRSSLHLAVQYNQLAVVRKLLERSAANKEQVEASKSNEQEGEDVEMKSVIETDYERPSSEDDWSSEEDEDKIGGTNEGGQKKNRKGFVVVPSAQKIEEEIKNTSDIPEDSTEEPDILDLNLADWDFAFTPLTHAVVAGSLPILEELLTAGADPNYEPEKQGTATFYHPLTASLLCKDPNTAMRIVERLIAAGASSTKITGQNLTVFHHAIIWNNIPVATALLRGDPRADVVINYPSDNAFPLSTAVYYNHYSLVVLLLSYQAKLNISAQDLAQIIPPQPYQSSISAASFVQPLEAALAIESPVIPLFAALGANVSAPIFDSHNGAHSSRKTYIDWLNFEISSIELRISVTESSATTDAAFVEEQQLSTWKGFLKQKMRAWEGNQKPINGSVQEEEIRKLKEQKSYYQSLKQMLDEYGAKTWDQVFPDKPSAAQNVVNNEHLQTFTADFGDLTYAHINEGRWGNVQDFEKERYDELFEACFTGDDEKVQALCLPPENSEQVPLKISVKVQYPTNRWYGIGITPLYAAVAGRRWETAKLVLAIVAAQYQGTEEDQKFRTDGIKFDDDDDNGSEYSEESDMTVDNKLHFYDIAKRPSTIQCNIHPSIVLDALRIPSPEGKNTHNARNILDQAIHAGDYEAFMKIGSLYHLFPQRIEFHGGLLSSILQKDSPEMLDQFIRWTGTGLDLAVLSKSEGQPVQASNDKDKLYLGLNVHGKKRIDLARTNDFSAQVGVQVHPMLWQACNVGAEKIVDYLAGERPLAAYKFYANSNSTELAFRIRHVKDLEKVLPEWLGWMVSPLGESPLSAAIGSNRLDIIKLLFMKAPRVLGPALHRKMKFSGYNLILLAVHSNCSAEVLDYLLAQSISPVERDFVNGWNIYHMCCSKNQPRLLEHLLKTLPRDVSEVLLVQQSKHCQYTPLHLAVKSGFIRAVELLLAFTKGGLLTRDIRGSIPLHHAIQASFAKITRLLIDASSVEELHTENGVGETPLSLAALLYLTDRVNSIKNTAAHVRYLTNSLWWRLTNSLWHCHGGRHDIKKLRAEIPQVRAVIQELILGGRVRENTQLYEQLQLFATQLDNHLIVAEQKEELRDKVAEEQRRADDLAANRHVGRHQETSEPLEDKPMDTRDIQTTFEIVEAAVKVKPGLRRLVHLIDVQQSVERDLDGARSMHRCDGNPVFNQPRRVFRMLRGSSRRVIISRRGVPGTEESEEMQEQQTMFLKVIPTQES